MWLRDGSAGNVLRLDTDLHRDFLFLCFKTESTLQAIK